MRHDCGGQARLTNLLEIFAALTGETPDRGRASATPATATSRPTWPALVVETLAPVQARYRELRADPAQLASMAAAGAQRAEAVAGPVYERAARAMGL